MRLTPVVKGAATYLPGLYKLVSKRRTAGTGGTDTATYCYGVWLKHLTLLWANGLRKIPDTIAELGPGDSLGIGLAALLSGVNHYYALDVVHYANTPRNLLILDQLVALLQRHAERPTKGWPDYDQYLDTNLFPSHILTQSVLERALAPDRIAAIRTALVMNPSSDADLITVRYVVPWNEACVIRQATVDLILSHSVLEHVVNLEDTYRACALWLKPGGWMSHQIDFTSHLLAKDWNGHWTYPDWLWKIIVGKRPFAINRQPCSRHVQLLQASEFEIVCHLKQTGVNGIKRPQLAVGWIGLSEADFTCAGTFIQARKP
jgi:hypothetical protein